MSIPWEGIEATIPPMADALAGKVVVSVVNALRSARAARSPSRASPPRRLVRATASRSWRPRRRSWWPTTTSRPPACRRRHHLNADVLVCGKSKAAREEVIELTKAIPGTRALDAGPLANALIIEGMTAIIINLNKRYGGEAGLDLGPRERPGAPA